MNRNAIVSALVAMSLTMGGPAFAQGDGPQQAQQRAQRQHQGQRANPHQGQRAIPQQGQRANPKQRRQPGYEQQARSGGQYQDERGAGPDRQFHRGDRLSPEYRNRSYVVDDWRGHHLSAPPRGYHWVQMGTDYVLVAIATGIILQLMLNN
jgi:Ni/Co efflux regulator RcnB